MVIAADINVSQKKSTAWQDGAVYKSLVSMAVMHPQHEFVFIFSRPLPGGMVFEKNITPVIATPNAGGRLLQYLWYNYKLPSVLSKCKADLFIGINGWCSVNLKLPQCLLVSEAVFSTGSPVFLKKQFPVFLKTATAIIATSNFCREQVIAACPAVAAKTQVAYTPVGEAFVPAAWAEKELVKEQYAAGREYFLHSTAIASQAQLVSLLKAWSLFKKRQKSNMLLILTGATALPGDKLKALLAAYKYRDEIKLISRLQPQSFVRLLGGAYALVHTGPGTQLPAEAMSCGVPVITGETPLLKEICGEAAMYANPADPADMAEKMMLVFKDETMRSRIIEKGTQQTKAFAAPAATLKLAEAILRTGKP
jgi:glycosyltransferase involved in cell wall biosynthesis